MLVAPLWLLACHPRPTDASALDPSGTGDTGASDPERCNGVDDDGDGRVDEGDAVDATDWYVDADRDGHGAGEPVRACEAPRRRVPTSGDCDDEDPTIHPGGVEACDEEDDDCDGAIDEGFDDDGDGALDRLACVFGTDCDDQDPGRAPGLEEVCDGVDQDCDGVPDQTFDLDGDGVPSAATCPARGTDCDDADASTFPGAPELCDGRTNGCGSDPVDEHGLVSFAPAAGGPWVPLEAAFSTGTPSASHLHDLEDGVLWLCGGEWNVRLRAVGVTAEVRSRDPIGDPARLVADAQGYAVRGESSDLTLEGLVISGGWSGVYLRGATARLSDVTVSDNGWDASYLGAGGIYATVGSTLECARCWIGGNFAEAGAGGVSVLFGSSATLSDSSITDNLGESVSGGGLVASDGSTLTLDGCVVSRNRTAGFGGGVSVSWGGASAVITDTTFEGNVAGDDGGGLRVVDGSAVVDGARFLENTADAGGAIHLRGTLDLTSSELVGNTAVDFGGGGIGVSEGELRATDVLVSSNHAEFGGGIDLGAFVGAATPTRATLTRVDLLDNTADARGGAAVLRWLSEVELVDTVVSGNEAPDYGGGLDLYGGRRQAPQVRATGGAITDNRTSGLGGGVFLEDDGEVFEAIGVDFGGNVPGDVSLGETPYDAGSAATFTCDAAGCRP